jgi:hypothetical protein
MQDKHVLHGSFYHFKKIIMKRLFVLFVTIALCCTSCIQLKVNYGGFRELTASEKNRILFFTDTHWVNNTPDSVVIAITADQLKQYMNQYDRCLVYFWRPGCNGAMCKSPIPVQEYCKKNKLHLILILHNYSEVSKFFALNIRLEQPVFAIDAFPYETDNVLKYIPKFRKELLGDVDKDCFINYWLYHNGNFEKKDLGD